MDVLQPFAYPIALVLVVVALALIFWKPIAGAINRIQRAAVGGNAIEFGEHRRAEQQVERQSEIAPTATTPTGSKRARCMTSRLRTSLKCMQTSPSTPSSTFP